ncbi:MAG: transporter ATP-binding protein [Clostridiales bacterium]|nr:transporter ATP-binding protein [Clostridiales bacterium]
MRESAIVTRDLTKKFGSLIAVNNLNLEVPRGKIFGILGPNGCGKSTTMRMLCGVIRPTSGTGEVLGYDIMKDSEAIKQNTGYMSQKFSLYQDLTVEENMQFYAGIYSLSNKEARKRMEKLKEMTNLRGKERALVSSLSGGWKQRVALACALIHNPKLLVLDEPTAGVDPVSRRIFWKIIHRLADEGVTVLVTTHYMDEAETCHNTAFLFSGRLLAYGSPNHLIKELKVSTLEEAFLSLVQRETGEEVEISFKSFLN